MTQLSTAVFLDRDGTLNRAFPSEDGVLHPPMSVDQLEILSGVEDALNQLKYAGFTLVVITNQPDVARGKLARATLDDINAALLARLPMLDHLECCCHDDSDQCACRKPRPGMLVRSAQQHGVDLQASFVIGDTWRDSGAARRAGCRSIQLGTWTGEPPQHDAGPDYWARDFRDASELVLKIAGHRAGS
jgi:D-glycero-D-manno-heptose 1,7-bisphosphate phosphatase